MLVLSSQSRLLGSNPVGWLCVQETVRTFMQPPARPWQKDERAQYLCCHGARAFLVCVLP